MTAASVLLVILAQGQAGAPLLPPQPLEFPPQGGAEAQLEPPSGLGQPNLTLPEPTPAAPLRGGPMRPQGQPRLAAPPAFAPAALEPPAGFQPTQPATPRFAPMAPAAAPVGSFPPNVAGGSAGQVTPTSGSQPTPSPTSGLIQTLLDGALQAPSRNALAGTRLTLAQALERSPDSTRRLAIAKHYWFVTYLVGEYNLALEEIDRLNELGKPQRQYDQVVHEAAVASATARAHEAELNAVVAQYELADLAMLPVVDSLPLPEDRPFTGAYRTEFERLFAGRSPPLALRKIDRTLPLRQRLIGTQAAAVATAAEQLNIEIEAYRGGQAPLASVVAAQDKVRLARSAFLMAARQYNFEIAEYVSAVAAPNVSNTSFLEMLLGSNRAPTRSVLVPTSGTIRPVAATAPIDGGLTPAAGLSPQPLAPQFQTIPAGGIPVQELSDLPSAAGDDSR